MGVHLRARPGPGTRPEGRRGRPHRLKERRTVLNPHGAGRPEKARDAIRAGAEAVQRARASRVKPYRPAAPIRFEVDIQSPDLADLASPPPGVTRTGARSVVDEDQDMLPVFRAWRAMLTAVPSRTPL
ncbi:MAG TPA: M55 family metallopeptidase [bacterium]|nr:M55 family metallopeptidase [bacterium]